MTDIQITKENGILHIAFDRESKKNAITAPMYQQLADALKDAESDSGIRAANHRRLVRVMIWKISLKILPAPKKHRYSSSSGRSVTPANLSSLPLPVSL